MQKHLTSSKDPSSPQRPFFFFTRREAQDWKLPGFQASRLPSFQASKLPGFQASRLPSFQASKLPGFQASLNNQGKDAPPGTPQKRHQSGVIVRRPATDAHVEEA
ncbi:hypothetical protein BM221_005029 [Beauveria bassiana]|uniref:Uncharacterized protein n=1 Tax=Beauveria bassiana TaxID=176275 RepID=A0A2N6NME5_BEABA|nr:hypothetical protein BM221_005029 [Beauveria bassiana]